MNHCINWGGWTCLQMIWHWVHYTHRQRERRMRWIGTCVSSRHSIRILFGRWSLFKWCLSNLTLIVDIYSIQPVSIQLLAAHYFLLLYTSNSIYSILQIYFPFHTQRTKTIKIQTHYANTLFKLLFLLLRLPRLRVIFLRFPLLRTMDFVEFQTFCWMNWLSSISFLIQI